jgi:hypothetical protein
MKYKLISDLHFEWHCDRGTQFIRELDTTDVDVLVVAGDIGFTPDTLPLLAAKGPQVVFVLGNHDYYGVDYKARLTAVQICCKKYPNLHWLQDSHVTIQGQRFIGGTLWFPDEPLNIMYEHDFADFKGIPKLRSWVYKANAKTQSYLKSNLLPTDFVVTHHAPTTQSISEQWTGHTDNRFFVCPMDNLIYKVNPALWMQHTHISFDYILKGSSTRILCNPLGYPWVLNEDFK